MRNKTVLCRNITLCFNSVMSLKRSASGQKLRDTITTCSRTRLGEDLWHYGLQLLVPVRQAPPLPRRSRKLVLKPIFLSAS